MTDKLITNKTEMVQPSNTVDCYMPEPVQKEINRIKRIATIYVELKSLMPEYKSEYMDVYVELADRFNAVGA